jgi:hypothetical protein
LRSSTIPNMSVSSSLWTTHWPTNGSISRFHLEAFAPSYPFQHAVWQDIWNPLCSNLIMFRPWGERLVYNSIKFPHILIIFPILFHNVSKWLRLSHLSIVSIPRCMCTHSINVTSVHFLCCAHDNEHIGTHDEVCDTFFAIA